MQDTSRTFSRIALACLIVLSLLPFAVHQSQALSVPTYTSKASLTGGSATYFQKVWVNSTHAFFFDVSGGTIERWHYNFATDTLSSMGTAIVDHGGTTCDADLFIGDVQTDHTVYVICKDSGTVNAVIANYNINTLAKNNGTAFALGAADYQPTGIAYTTRQIYYTLFDEVGASADQFIIGNTSRAYVGGTGASSGVILEANQAELPIVAKSGTRDAVFVMYNEDADPNLELRLAKFQGTLTFSGILDDAADVDASQTLAITGSKVVYTAFENNPTPGMLEVDVNSLDFTFEETGVMGGRPIQYLNISNAAQTLPDDDEAICFSSEETTRAWNPSTGDRSACFLYPEFITPGTGTITGLDDPKIYALNADHIISATTAGATTWTIYEVTDNDTPVEIATYSEEVGTPLITNVTVAQAGLVKIVCDVTYDLPNPKVYFQEADDCVTIKTIPTASDTVGRILDFNTTASAVHANPMTSYTIAIATGNPTFYEILTRYDGTDVDSGIFDSGGSTSQRLLYQQCYTVQISEISTGNVVQFGFICADDVTTKTVSLVGITIPDDWLAQPWDYALQRDFDNSTNPNANSTNNHVLFTFEKAVKPYSASVHVTDNIFDTPTVDAWFNFTSVNGTSVINMTGIASNQTLYFDLYEDNELILTAISAASEFDYDIFSPSEFGLFFGLPAAFIFPVLTAALFPKSMAYFGAIVTVAVIGLMTLFGVIDLPIWFWGLIMPILALAIVIGAKR